MDREKVRRILRTWKMLVVDDDLEGARLLQRCMGVYGAEAYIATDGASALELIDRVRPMVILTDLSMPGMSGWELLKVIRSTTRWQRLPVVAVTAHVLGGIREQVLDAGFDAYVSKPFYPSVLAQELVSMAEARSWRPVPATGELCLRSKLLSRVHA